MMAWNLEAGVAKVAYMIPIFVCLCKLKFGSLSLRK